ncbi:type I-F CRISPR-associated endoribonuclease Cas6/Csy4 [Methylothermus subterraneus]
MTTGPKLDRYIDIRLLPDPEFPATVLMNALFAKLHRALVTLKTDQIGVSFPDVENVDRGLGERLRVHGDAQMLQRLMELGWLTGLSDLLKVSAARQVPASAHHRTVRRVQAKSSPERLRRRWMKRKGLSEEQAREIIPDSAAERLDLPYLTLTSRSTGQRFRLFIEHGPLLTAPIPGCFSRYGLSSKATVPWF